MLFVGSKGKASSDSVTWDRWDWSWEVRPVRTGNFNLTACAGSGITVGGDLRHWVNHQM